MIDTYIVSFLSFTSASKVKGRNWALSLLSTSRKEIKLSFPSKIGVCNTQVTGWRWTIPVLTVCSACSSNFYRVSIHYRDVNGFSCVPQWPMRFEFSENTHSRNLAGNMRKGRAGTLRRNWILIKDFELPWAPQSSKPYAWSHRELKIEAW